MKPSEHKLCVGDWVEIRSKEEILRTLDSNGQLEGMPFMPEMFNFCGKRLQVYKRAHKTCDTVFPVRGRRVESAVHLETRCDGSAHDGCQASCLIFWKELWLKPVSAPSNNVTDVLPGSQLQAENNGSAANPTMESAVWAGTRVTGQHGSEPVYVCQATRLPYATSKLDWWDIRQYIEDFRSGNASLWQIFCGFVYFLFYATSNAGIGVGRPIRWFYDKFYALWGGAPFPRKWGTIPDGQPTPGGTLDLQPGELVRIKSHAEILKTLDTRNKNRGLYFDAEEVPYCGGTYRVLKRVSKIINERTGKMRKMKSPCIILDSVFCQSRYSECRLFCPRSIFAYWREIWLERVEPKPPGEQPEEAHQLASQR